MDTIYDFVGNYGPAFREGVLSDHLDAADHAGMMVRVAPSGRVWVAAPTGGRAYPMVCSEFVHIDTEDGPITGRCGVPASFDRGRCPRHGG